MNFKTVKKFNILVFAETEWIDLFDLEAMMSSGDWSLCPDQYKWAGVLPRFHTPSFLYPSPPHHIGLKPSPQKEAAL